MEIRSEYQDLKDINELLKKKTSEPMILERQLNEARLAANVKALESSSVLSGMGHEIRTPMNSIIGMTSILLQDESLTSDQKEFVGTIKVCGDALMEVLNDILDFSRLESGNLTLNHQPFNLQIFAEETLGLIAIDASRKGLILSHRFNGTVPDCIIQDSMRLRQIILNLLDNAVKSTNGGEIRLNISSQKIQGAHEVHFAIQDTGNGIPSYLINDLFLPFGKKDILRSREYGGSGLGLAISKGLVELMGGEIWVESAENIGSTFHFTIKADPCPNIQK